MQTDKTPPQLFTGCFLDEKCAVFAAKVERLILRTLQQTREHALRTGGSFSSSFRVAMKAYQSFGLDKERDLTAALDREDPSLAVYQRFTILTFANSLASVQDGPDDEFRVTAILPSTGQFIQEVHVQLGMQGSTVQAMMNDVVSMKLGCMDCIRLSLLKFVQPKSHASAIADRARPDVASASRGEMTQPDVFAADGHDAGADAYMEDVLPSDSISQVGRSEPAEASAPPSLFNRRVQERLAEMREDCVETAPNFQIAAESSVSGPSMPPS
jgi:hypothetical protein